MRSGARVELVDPNGIASQASGGIVGALAPHVPENWNPKKQFQFESLCLAQSFWEEISEISGKNPGYARAGRVQPLADDAAVALARKRGDGAKELWQGQADWTLIDDPKGWDIPSPSGVFVFDTLSAHIHPHQACLALAAVLEMEGVKLLDQPEHAAAATIWATGTAGLDALNDGAKREIGRGIKGQAALLRVDRSSLPQVFVDTLHIIPHLDGTVAIGSTTERDFDAPLETDVQLDDLIERAKAAVPDLRNADVVQRWAGLRPRARSRAPILGPWPDRQGHFIANGGFKIGFGMAPKAAACMSQLVLEGINTIPEGFDLSASL